MNYSPNSDPWIGRSVGENQRYRIQQRIGGGSMGDVFVAIDTRLGQQVAIKVLKSNLAGAQELSRRFEHEVALCAALKGEHVVQVSDYGITSEGYPFYVMEYLKGQTLGQLLRQEQRLPVARTVNIITQVCEGLELAHSGVMLQREGQRIKVVHRDLKPDNVFLVSTSLGELVKILDFGIAKIHHDQRENTHLTSMFIGTFHFASPEQVEVRQGLDGRSDIYSLGVILYEMLSGTDPFGFGADVQDMSQMSWAIAHVSKSPIPLRAQPGCQHLLPELAAVVMRCLQKNPDDRFPTVKALSQALKAAASLSSDNTQDWYSPVPAAEIVAPEPAVPETVAPETIDPALINSATVSSGSISAASGKTTKISPVQRSVPSTRTAASSYTAIRPAPEAELTATQGSVALLLPEPKSEPGSARRSSPLILAIAGFAVAAVVSIPAVYFLGGDGDSPTKPSPSPSQPVYDEFLNQANTLAASGKFSEAIDLVIQQVPATSSTYVAAKSRIDEWSKQLLGQATQTFRSNNSKEALTLALTQLQSIPSLSSVYAEAQTQKQQWQTDWTKAEQLLTQAKEAEAQAQWQKVLDVAAKVPQIRFWQEQAKPLALKAREQLDKPVTIPEPAFEAPAPAPEPEPPSSSSFEEPTYVPAPAPAPAAPAPAPAPAPVLQPSTNVL